MIGVTFYFKINSGDLTYAGRSTHKYFEEA